MVNSYGFVQSYQLLTVRLVVVRIALWIQMKSPDKMITFSYKIRLEVFYFPMNVTFYASVTLEIEIIWTNNLLIFTHAHTK